MGDKATRISLLIVTFMFLLSTVAFAGIIVYTMFFDDEPETADQVDQDQFEDLEEDSVDLGTMENFEPTDRAITEIEIIDIEEGTGAEVQAGGTVVAHYTGALVRTGEVFDSSVSRGEPAEFSLEQVIQGWQEGVPGMKAGGKRRLIIPAELAYGESGSPPSIGPNEPLVFDIELIEAK